MNPVKTPPRIPCFRPCLGPEESAAITRVLESRWLSVGGVTQQFEQRLQDLLQVPHVIAVTSGTAALHLALLVLGLDEGDEVILPSLTFISAAQMIRAVGARPVFCDVDPATLNTDPEDVVRRITPLTRAILPVHYGGYPCDMARLRQIAQAHSLILLDDAAHAFGSHYCGKMIGAVGDLTCFSFSPVKNITCGEGGAVATSNPEYASKLRALSNLGISASTWDRLGTQANWNFSIATAGFRYALPNLNAAVGLVQLDRLTHSHASKLAIKRRYDEAFRSIAGITPVHQLEKDVHPYSYTVRISGGRRDALIDHLSRSGIGSSVHYPPNHLQPLFNTNLCLPVTECLAKELLCLPLYAGMTDSETVEVIDSVSQFLRD